MEAVSELSNIQKELLKLYAHNVSDEQLRSIKQMLADFFAKEIDRQMAELWVKNYLFNLFRVSPTLQLLNLIFKVYRFAGCCGSDFGADTLCLNT